jgi:serine protease
VFEGSRLRNTIFGLLTILASISMAHPAHAADGPPQQIIVKWRDNLPAGDPAAFTAQVLRSAGVRHGVSLQRVRSTADGADIVKPSRPVSRAEMDHIIKTLSDNPHVEYVEEDSLMRPMPRG